MLIRQRRPKLQAERRLSTMSQHNEGKFDRIVDPYALSLYSYLETDKLSILRSYRGVRMSVDAGTSRRPMSTIVELSPEQAQTSTEDLHFGKEIPRVSLTPLAHGRTG